MKGNLLKDAYYYNEKFHTDYCKIQLQILSHGYAKLRPGWKVSNSTSTYSRLLFVEEGELKIHSDKNETFTITGGQYIFIPAKYNFEMECIAHLTQLHFHIRLCRIDGLDMLGQCNTPLLMHCTAEEINTLVQKIHSEDMLDSLFIKQDLLNIVYTFLRQNHIQLTLTEYTHQIKQALNYINRNLSNQLTVAEIAQHAFIAPSTLARDFKNATGMSVGEYIDISIMSKAEQLLKARQKSIEEISEQLGFCDQAYFARRFKKFFHITPLAYRNNTRL